MKVDFWEWSSDSAEKVVAMIAARVLEQGERLLVVSGDEAQRKAISRALWEAKPESFLANGEAGAIGADRQPILLSASCEPANGASHVIFADGHWRPPEGFERAFLLFDETTKANARGAWRSLDGTQELERNFYRQDDGKWVKVG